DRGELFLVWDTTTKDLFSSALPAADVVKALNRCQAENKLLILDCCRAGGAVGLKDGLGVPVDELNIKPDNSLVLMASGRLESAREFDSLEGSFLARHMADALTDNFFDADKDEDNRISVHDLMQWLTDRALQHNSSSKEKVPYPSLFGQQKGAQF